VRGSARIYDVRMTQFVLKIEKLSHIIGARGSQDLRSPSPIMAPALLQYANEGCQTLLNMKNQLPGFLFLCMHVVLFL